MERSRLSCRSFQKWLLLIIIVDLARAARVTHFGKVTVSIDRGVVTFRMSVQLSENIAVNTLHICHFSPWNHAQQYVCGQSRRRPTKRPMCGTGHQASSEFAYKSQNLSFSRKLLLRSERHCCCTASNSLSMFGCNLPPSCFSISQQPRLAIACTREQYNASNPRPHVKPQYVPLACMNLPHPVHPVSGTP